MIILEGMFETSYVNSIRRKQFKLNLLRIFGIYFLIQSVCSGVVQESPGQVQTTDAAATLSTAAK